MSFFIIERRLYFTSHGLPLCSLCPFCMTFIISFLLIVGCSLYTLYLIYYHFNGGDSHQAKMKIITVVRSLDKCGSPSPKRRHETSSLLLRVPLGPLLANTSSRSHPSELCHWRADVSSWTSFNGITQIGSFMSLSFVHVSFWEFTVHICCNSVFWVHWIVVSHVSRLLALQIESIQKLYEMNADLGCYCFLTDMMWQTLASCWHCMICSNHLDVCQGHASFLSQCWSSCMRNFSVCKGDYEGVVLELEGQLNHLLIGHCLCICWVPYWWTDWFSPLVLLGTWLLWTLCMSLCGYVLWLLLDKHLRAEELGPLRVYV